MNDHVIYIQSNATVIGSMEIRQRDALSSHRLITCFLCTDLSDYKVTLFFLIYGEVMDNYATGNLIQLAESPFSHMIFSDMFSFQAFLRDEYEVA